MGISARLLLNACNEIRAVLAQQVFERARSNYC
jgi:hypothetical protein